MSQQRLMFHRWRADKAFAALGAEARDLFYGLMGICDTWGCLKVNAIPIRNEVYLGAESLPPATKVVAWLGELEHYGCLRMWSEGGKDYAELKWFMDEQRIRYRRRRETPCPPWRSVGDDPLAPPGGPSVAGANEGAEEKRREEKRREENHPEGSSLRAGDNPEVPVSQRRAGRHSPGVGQAPGVQVPSALVDTMRLVLGLPPPDTPAEAHAWEAILARAADWGPCLPSTLATLTEYVRRRPQLAVAWVLHLDGNPKVTSPWGCLLHTIKEGWAPPQRDEDAARFLVKPRREAHEGRAPLGTALGGLMGRLKGEMT